MHFLMMTVLYFHEVVPGNPVINYFFRIRRIRV